MHTPGDFYRDWPYSPVDRHTRVFCGGQEQEEIKIKTKIIYDKLSVRVVFCNAYVCMAVTIQ